MQQPFPKILYKYRSWQENESHLADNKKYHRKILTENQVFFANAYSFNDPFDCTIPKRYDLLSNDEKRKQIFYHLKSGNPKQSDEIINEQIDKILAKGHLDDKEYLFKANKSNILDFVARFGILSLTKKRDNILMWSHYANNHKGFCVGFNSDALLKELESKNEKGKRIYFRRKVDYCKKYPIVKPVTDKRENLNNSIQRLTTKSILWKYEKEFRYIVNGGTNVPIELSTDIFEEIIFGCEIDPKIKDDILKIIDNRFPDIRLYEAKQNSEKFKIDIDLIK